MRVSSAAAKSERIKTHQRSFYVPNLKEHVMQQWGSTNKVWIPKTSRYQPNTIRALDYKTTALLYYCGSTLPSLKRPRHRKRPLYGGLATYSAIL
ncbi:hypothetical protein M9H77_35939 [Catharanthus roseus]|uniref:Uncharacterized protein n=1 Tax=Catharanthus roseus TaxID=4058 RepID=A0ACB9ZS65_CATRO|nr:hypothetical protein M9H77_35939 [Catharanthus roseus]